MQYIIGAAGLFLVFGMAFIFSSDRKKIKYRPLIVMVVLQFVFGFLLLNTSAGNLLISAIANGFMALLACANEGITFVFGRLADTSNPIFFTSVLMPITFISALIGILQHWKILPFIIKYIGLALSKINGMGKLESYNAVASAILGQSEVFISVKKQLGPLPAHRLYTLCASAMSTVSMSIVGAYMVMIEPKYVVTALVLNLFGGFIIASIINPYEVKPEDDILVEAQVKRQSFFEMLGEYILDGFKVGVIVCAMLIGFVGIITLINNVFLGIIIISFQQILGYIFSPFAFFMSIPMNECVDAASLMATKIVANEFVAMMQLSDGTVLLSARSIAIVSVFLVSFANFSSIGIIAGAVKALNEEKGNVVARFGLKLLYGATLVSILNATVVSLII
ncbi:NupC/NupG family nucleoside CNT transporter [Megamonas hypermegale]|uniref:NupC/NupG family nucleoside CNT transporter n=1 Tax=Megamonas hypermegale TaxID=158847 RepID=UPI0026E9243A|nr:nucleoside transporter C-terminal domain-containing protein [Megamonas hypermegale]